MFDFTNPAEAREIAYFDERDDATTPAYDGSNQWAAYWYNGNAYANGTRGFEIFELNDSRVSGAETYPYLNPQTQIDVIPGRGLLRCTIMGTSRADQLEGTSGDDVICGLGGNDFVTAGRGNDRVLGGNGRDSVLGGSGDDRLRGEAGGDGLYGGAGNDSLKGGSWLWTTWTVVGIPTRAGEARAMTRSPGANAGANDRHHLSFGPHSQEVTRGAPVTGPLLRVTERLFIPS